jgi:hypothetical protein
VAASSLVRHPLVREGTFHAGERTMLQDVDEHIDWIETQQELIRQIGLERYLSEQIRKEVS